MSSSNGADRNDFGRLVQEGIELLRRAEGPALPEWTRRFAPEIVAEFDAADLWDMEPEDLEGLIALAAKFSDPYIEPRGDRRPTEPPQRDPAEEALRAAAIRRELRQVHQARAEENAHRSVPRPAEKTRGTPLASVPPAPPAVAQRRPSPVLVAAVAAGWVVAAGLGVVLLFERPQLGRYQHLGSGLAYLDTATGAVCVLRSSRSLEVDCGQQPRSVSRR